MPGTTIFTDYTALYMLSKEMKRFADEIQSNIDRLARETSSLTSTSWKGRQADEFNSSIAEAKKKMAAEAEKLRTLSDAVFEKAKALEESISKKMNF